VILAGGAPHNDDAAAPPRVTLARALPSDRALLIRANQDSRAHHLPWVEHFIDDAGFDAWFARSLSGPHVGLVAREISGAQIVGIININEIVAGLSRVPISPITVWRGALNAG